jgi:hypothetical protein
MEDGNPRSSILDLQANFIWYAAFSPARISVTTVGPSPSGISVRPAREQSRSDRFALTLFGDVNHRNSSNFVTVSERLGRSQVDSVVLESVFAPGGLL